jgi:hypothetical protein
VFTCFQFLHDPADLLLDLRADGWDLHSGPGGAVVGTHPDVPDQAAARYRLDRLGLLTSRSLRIRFHHSRRAPGS